MPAIAPLSKVMASRGYDTEVVLTGQVYAEAFADLRKLGDEQNDTFIYAFTD